MIQFKCYKIKYIKNVIKFINLMLHTKQMQYVCVSFLNMLIIKN